jgi:hypothetical protein
VRERYHRAFAPIFVVDFGAVLGGDRARTHSMNFSISVKVDLPIVNLIQIVNQMIIYLDYGKKKDLVAKMKASSIHPLALPLVH